MSELILSVDLGTTALKIALFNQSGELKALSAQEYALLTPATSFVEVNANTYWESFKKGLLEIKHKYNYAPGAVTALGLSAQGETLFFLDKNNSPLRNAIVWMDNRAQEEAAQLTAEFTDEECYRVTGQVSFDPCWPAAKILWIKKHEPELFAQTARFMLIEDYFIHRLTGQFVSEGSLLCSTTYWNITTKAWWREMLGYLGISEERLPEIKEPGQAIGPILPAVAAELGLSKEIVVCTGALDQAAGAIGVGNIAEGIFSENIGAALAICAPVNKPVYDPNRSMPLHYFAIPDMYMMHTFTTGGMALRWFRDKFCDLEISAANLMGEDAYGLLTKEAANVAPGSEGLVMLPHLSGSMAPDVNSKARGVYFGFTLKHQKQHFIRALMESLGYIVRRNIDALSGMGIEVQEIRSLGGGSRSKLWNQIKADITGKQLVTLKCEEAACLGAAILAGKATGLFSDIKTACNRMALIEERFYPNTANAEVYGSGYEIYKKLFFDLTGLFESSFVQ
jgi:xylulokinase